MSKNFCNMNGGARINVTIPNGFCYKEGTVDNGYVIENSTGDQYVLIPSGYTTEGIYVRAFWVSRFEISKGNNGIPKSVKGKEPWTGIDFIEACNIAQKVDGSLISAEQYSRICTWLVETKAADFVSVYFDGNFQGNYDPNCTFAKTGSNPEWQHNHIYDFFGNGYIWTTEKSELYHHHRVIRGGHSSSGRKEICYPPSNRAWAKKDKVSNTTTLRIVLNVVEETEEEEA